MISFIWFLSIFCYLFQSSFALLINIMLLIIVFLKENRMLDFLVSGLIISMPTSFVNIFGGEYGKLPLSWFNIFCLSIVLYVIIIFIKNKKIRVKISYLNLSFLFFLMYLFIELLNSNEATSAISSFLTISLPLLTIICLSLLNKINLHFEKLMLFYIQGAYYSAYILIIQILLHKYLSFSSGYIKYMSNRIAYGGLFRDFSFFSVYLASAAVYLFIQAFNDKKTNNYFKIIILLVASLLTTARTGIIASIISLIIFLVYTVISANDMKKIKSIIMIFLIIISGGIAAQILMNIRLESQGILGASGREGTYNSALTIFKMHPFLGIGIGTDNYVNYVNTHLFGYDSTLPHNILFQTLAQYGIIGLLILFNCFFAVYCTIIKKRSLNLLMCFNVIIISHLVLPDLLNTRYFPIIVLLIVLSNNKNEFA